MKYLKSRWKEISITQLLQIVFSATLIGVLITFSATYYAYTSNLVKENIQTSLKDFAISAQYIIDGDKHESITDAKSIAFKVLCNQLTEYQKAVGVYDVYTLVKGDEHHTKMFLAAYDAEKTFLKPYILTDDMRKAFTGKITVTNVPYSDEFGTFYSAYAPLFNSSHEIIGLVVVDINIERINALKRDIVVKTLVLFVICFIVGNVCVYLLANSLGKSFKRMMEELKKIGEGNLDVTLESELPIISEMKELEETIHDMANEISSLIQIMAGNARDLKEKSGHISELISTSNTSSQVMASAVEQMCNVHQDASEAFDGSLKELLLYKENSTDSISEYRAVLGSVQATKDNLEEILQYLRHVNAGRADHEIVGEFEIVCQRLYLQYDLFTNSINTQMSLLDVISCRRDGLVELNQKIFEDFKVISHGNQLVMEAMEKQVAAMADAVGDVDDLKRMASALSEKLDALKTKG